MATKAPRAWSAVVVLVPGLGLTACAGALTPPQLALPSLPKVAVPEMTLPDVKLPKFELPKGMGPVVGTPTEVYTRIGRGALLCWFGGNGPLKGKYIYHADAEPPSRGGRAEIGIHTIDTTGPTPRGPKVFRIGIVPEGQTAALTVENTKLPDTLARQMWEDAHRWASTQDDVACRDEPTAAGWQPQAPAVAPAATTPPQRKGPAKKASDQKS
jgi:hypothetical protein